MFNNDAIKEQAVYAIINQAKKEAEAKECINEALKSIQEIKSAILENKR